LRRKDKELIKKYDELAQAIFMDMFGGYQNVIKLNKICTKITDGVHAKPIYRDEGIPFLSVKNATKKYLDFNEVKYISPQDHNAFIKRCHPEKNDILYTKVGATYGRAALVDTDKEFSIFVSLALIKPSQKIVLPEYLHFILNSDFVKKQADRRIRGAGVPDLHLIEIRDFDIPLPKIDEQIKFVNQIRNINKIKKTTTIDQSENLFQSLLIQAFQRELN
jgi:type I restriction enzyme, S subunit